MGRHDVAHAQGGHLPGPSLRAHNSSGDSGKVWPSGKVLTAFAVLGGDAPTRWRRILCRANADRWREPGRQCVITPAVYADSLTHECQCPLPNERLYSPRADQETHPSKPGQCGRRECVHSIGHARIPNGL